MTDVFSEQKRSEVMSQIRSEDTGPEKILRKALSALGMQYRLHVKSLPGTPDIVLPRFRTLIQVRGCFWHGHHCIDGHIPNSRRDYWESKLLRNRRRDAKNDRSLRRSGWSVITAWECRLQNRQGLEKEIRRVLRICEANATKHREARCQSLEYMGREVQRQ